MIDARTEIFTSAIIEADVNDTPAAASGVRMYIARENLVRFTHVRGEAFLAITITASSLMITICFFTLNFDILIEHKLYSLWRKYERVRAAYRCVKLNVRHRVTPLTARCKVAEKGRRDLSFLSLYFAKLHRLEPSLRTRSPLIARADRSRTSLATPSPFLLLSPTRGLVRSRLHFPRFVRRARWIDLSAPPFSPSPSALSLSFSFADHSARASASHLFILRVTFVRSRKRSFIDTFLRITCATTSFR